MPNDNSYWNQGRLGPDGRPYAQVQTPAARMQDAADSSAGAQPGQQAFAQGPLPGGQQGAYQQGAYQQGAFQQGYQQAYQQSAYAAGPVSYQQPKQNRSFGWIVPVVIIVCLFLFTAFCVKMCTDAVGTLSNNSSHIGMEAVSGDAIGIINIDGTIQYDGSACSPEGFKELLDEASKNSNIKAVVLRVNSGGGVATAGEEMAEYLREFDKPVVVSSASLNASAAYEISAQADYIYVAKSTEIGAIGTAFQLTDLSGLLEKLGISMEVITSADSKDSSYGYRPLTEEEREYYQDMVDKINDMFVDNVAVGRKMDVKEVKKLATGLVYTGLDSIENGLADEVGTREDAIAKAAELAGVTTYETTDLYLSTYDISSLASLLGESRVSADDIIDALADKGGTKIK